MVSSLLRSIRIPAAAAATTLAFVATTTTQSRSTPPAVVHSHAAQDDDQVAARLAKIEAKLDELVPSAPRDRDPGQLQWKDDNIESVLYSEQQIATRVKQLGKKITADFSYTTEGDFVVVGLLSGAYVFMADLCREIDTPHIVDFMSVSSYGAGTVSSANVKIKKDLNLSIEGKTVLLVDEMCDSGRTLASLKKLLEDRGAKSVHTCCLFDKKSRRVVGVEIDYVGVECPDEFVVGYGMDWGDRYRSLRNVCVVKRSAYE